jgi:hypothetical protein
VIQDFLDVQAQDAGGGHETGGCRPGGQFVGPQQAAASVRDSELRGHATQSPAAVRPWLDGESLS